jgi:DNA-3-methyladenine glycosylase
MLPPDFFHQDAVNVARALIGVGFYVDGIGGPIVETEAYVRDDPASHSFRGRTPRNGAMFGPAGCVYVYRSYGMHWCINFVCGERETGEAVLIRALEPAAGLAEMAGRRRLSDPRLLCAGPGRLTEALGVSRVHDGLPLDRAPFRLDRLEAGPPQVLAGPRIGITKAVEKPWRFGLAGSPFLSRRFPAGAAG